MVKRGNGNTWLDLDADLICWLLHELNNLPVPPEQRTLSLSQIQIPGLLRSNQDHTPLLELKNRRSELFIIYDISLD
jgi:hypothetical protein